MIYKNKNEKFLALSRKHFIYKHEICEQNQKNVDKFYSDNCNNKSVINVNQY